MVYPNPADLHRAARIFKGLAHPARLELACRLAAAPRMTQKELLQQLRWPQSTMARHLGQMRERGLIKGTRAGNQVYLELTGTVTPQLLTAVCGWVHPDTGDRLGAPLAEPAQGTQ